MIAIVIHIAIVLAIFGAIRDSVMLINAYPCKGNRRLSVEFPDLILKGTIMDKDRINGAADQAKGSIKEAAGKVTGDAKLQTEGTLDKAKGKVESAIGGVKDAVRNAN
jgi:uncharacterized protein YjbJ (UPF0337 family)